MERKYTFNLRMYWIRAPRNKRANRAVRALIDLVKRHMKVEEVKLDNFVNQFIWSRGAQKPPHKITVTVKKEDNKAFVKLG